MKHRVTSIAGLVLAIGLLALDPAHAAVDPGGPTHGAPGVRPAPTAPALCVSTTWRAHFTHKPKTKPGHQCRAIPGVWVPKSWVLLAPGVYLAK